MEAGSVPDEFASEMEQEIVNGTFSYEPQADKRTLERVNADIEYNGWEESMTRWKAVVNGTERATKENIVLGEMLLVNAANAGDTELARLNILILLKQQKTWANCILPQVFHIFFFIRRSDLQI